MNYFIKDWVLEQGFEHYKVKGEKKGGKTVLPNLSKINIFVGANNTGKSRFMRKLASEPQIFFAPHIESEKLAANFSKLDSYRDAFIEDINQMLRNFGAKKTNALLELDGENKESLEFISEGISTNILVSKLTNIGATAHFTFDSPRPVPQSVSDAIKNKANEYRQLISSEKTGLLPKYEFKRTYIPTLRGLRTFENVADNDIYQSKTQKDYFSNTKSPVEIFTGLQMYTKIHDMLTGNLLDRKNIASFEKFLSVNFFQNKSVTLIPSNKGVLNVKIGFEREFPIHDLGDGIQSIIILTFPIFANPNTKLLAFFEEPELYMHPGIQRIFLDVLNRFPEHQYFITTHSNHFLDITLDVPSVSVFTFQKQMEDVEKDEIESTIIIENVNNEAHVALGLLGVRNSSVFLSNCTIWVEGITDRRYLSRYLDLYQNTLPNGEKKYREDLHYSFVEYGGSNITHWSFLDVEDDSIEVDRLCGKLFLITDKDNSKSSAKKQRHSELKAKLGDTYYCLKCREIENLLSPEVLKAVVLEYEKGATVEDNNAVIEFKAFKQASYKSASLGVFIETKILKGQRLRKRAYASQSGTTSDKVNFCERAIGHLNSFQDLSVEAQKLTELLYKFIKEHNKTT